MGSARPDFSDHSPRWPALTGKPSRDPDDRQCWFPRHRLAAKAMLVVHVDGVTSPDAGKPGPSSDERGSGAGPA